MSGRYRGKHSVRNAVLLTAAVLAAIAVGAAAAILLPPFDWPPDVSAPVGNLSSQSDGSQDASGSGASSQPQPDVSEPGPDASASRPDTTQPDKYDFSQPAPEREAVDNHYFDDAAFVGDSRTDGFMIYSGIGTGKNLTSNGLSIFKLGEKKALTIRGEQYTLLEALALEQYGKVYLSLGVNELGTYNDDGFYQCYGQAIDEIRRLQPNAVIYIQGLIPLNEGQIRQTNGNKYHLTNEHLRVYNDLMKQVAEEKQVVFLDLYPEFVTEDGELPAEASKDGVHLATEYCRQWLDYLKTHTVDFDTLYPDGPSPVEPVSDITTADGSVQG